MIIKKKFTTAVVFAPHRFINRYTERVPYYATSSYPERQRKS